MCTCTLRERPVRVRRTYITLGSGVHPQHSVLVPRTAGFAQLGRSVRKWLHAPPVGPCCWECPPQCAAMSSNARRCAQGCQRRPSSRPPALGDTVYKPADKFARMTTSQPFRSRDMLLLSVAAAGSVLFVFWRRLRRRLAATSNAAALTEEQHVDQKTEAGGGMAPVPSGTELRCDRMGVATTTGATDGEIRGAASATGTALLKQLRSRKSAAEEPHIKAYYAASRALKVTAAPEDDWTTDEHGRRRRVRAAASGTRSDREKAATAPYGAAVTDDKAPCKHGIQGSSCLVCQKDSRGVHGHSTETAGATPVCGSDASEVGALGGRADGRAVARSSYPASSSIEGDAVMRIASLQPKLVERVNAACDDLVAPSLEPAAELPEGEEDAAAGWALVRQHNTENACWIVISGHVLDVTAYLGHHPGGSTIIQRLAGRDATRAYEKARHSRGADMKLADFTVGRLSDLKRLRRAAREAREFRSRLEAAAKYLD
eukprot:785944-Prymnesium_polylepis.1